MHPGISPTLPVSDSTDIFGSIPDSAFLALDTNSSTKPVQIQPLQNSVLHHMNSTTEYHMRTPPRNPYPSQHIYQQQNNINPTPASMWGGIPDSAILQLNYPQLSQYHTRHTVTRHQYPYTPNTQRSSHTYYRSLPEHVVSQVPSSQSSWKIGIEFEERTR